MKWDETFGRCHVTAEMIAEPRFRAARPYEGAGNAFDFRNRIM